MRALHSPVPNHTRNKEKYHMGCSDHFKIQHNTPSKAAFNIYTQRSHYPISQMHYSSMIAYFKSFQRLVKRAGMFIQIIVNGSFKIPPKELIQPVFFAIILMPLTIPCSYLTTVFTCKIR